MASDFSFLSNEDPCHEYYQFTRKSNFRLMDKINHLLPTDISTLDFFNDSYILVDKETNSKHKAKNQEIGNLLAGYDEVEVESFETLAAKKKLPFEFETPEAFKIDISPISTKLIQEIVTYLWHVGDIQRIKLSFMLEAEPGPTSFPFLIQRSDLNFYFKRLLAQAELDLRSRKLKENDEDLSNLSKEATEFCKGLELCLMLKKENSRQVSLERLDCNHSSSNSPTSWLDSCTSSSESLRSRRSRRKRRDECRSKRSRKEENRRKRRYHSSRHKYSSSEDDHVYRKKRRCRSLSRNRVY
eukprot:GHVP01041526.1.p1 GENE.GHVP01041526.1~~GHVP01041526.1.p1  ORF type:complete len:299 (-),score=47.16 GHVP01041526.1:53-949(-)